MLAEINQAIGAYDSVNAQREERIARYKDCMGDYFIEYDKESWFEQAVRKSMGWLKWKYTWKENYQESHWYKFQEAVKAHQKLAKDIILKPIFEKMDLVNFQIDSPGKHRSLRMPPFIRAFTKLW